MGMRNFRHSLYYVYIISIILILVLIRRSFLNYGNLENFVASTITVQNLSPFGHSTTVGKRDDDSDHAVEQILTEKDDEIAVTTLKNKLAKCGSTKLCCRKIIQGHRSSIEWAKKVEQTETDDQILNQLSDCSRFFDARGYVWGPILSNDLESEANLPVAYSILVHLDLQHLEKLLRAIYQPQNIYCIHVDKKSINLREKVEKLTRCFPNIFTSQYSQPVYWGGFGVLNSTLSCLDELVKYNNRSHNWDYFINLSAQDMPLKTNLEMVEILKTWNGASNVEVLDESNTKRFQFKYKTIINKFGNPDGNTRTDQLKDAPPFDLKIYKGNLAVILSRDMANWITDSKNVKTFVRWLQDTDIPDEHFWATIVGNAKKFEHLNEESKFYDSRLFRLTKPYIARYVTWKNGTKSVGEQRCRGKFVRDVCVYGVQDLAHLTKAHHFFANKFHINFQPLTYTCIEEWLRHKRQKETILIDRNE